MTSHLRVLKVAIISSKAIFSVYLTDFLEDPAHRRTNWIKAFDKSLGVHKECLPKTVLPRDIVKVEVIEWYQGPALK